MASDRSQKLISYLNHCHFILGVFLFYLLFLKNSLLSYEVQFDGVNDPDVYKLVVSVSQLEKLKETPPATAIGLKRRAEGDVTNIIQALHSLAYYNAKVDFSIENQGELVIVKTDLGSVYPFAYLQIRYTQYGDPIERFDGDICLDKLGIYVGDAALPETILNAEDTLLDQLNLQGYAFAAIKKRDVIVDQQRQDVTVIFNVEIGPLTYFGPVTICGRERICSDFFYNKLRWAKGDLYDPRKIEKTQEALELSGLFRSVNITHAEEPLEGNLLPLTISVVEAKQRSVGFGLNYTTELGPGITGEWEDRNFQGSGQKLSFRADIWQRLQEGSITYLIPDYKRSDQNLIWQLNYEHEKTEAFVESTLSISATIERKLSECLRFSYGGMYKFMLSQDSDHNGIFDLLQLPLQLQWSNANSLLDPISGGSIHVRVIPSLQVREPPFGYCINTFTGSLYRSLTKDNRHVFATKLMLGSIIGASEYNIPPPERLYAGSENALRGYKYLTVSPLDDDHKPIGGRSLFIYSLELRNRIGENFGWVAFYDIGNVYANFYPDFKEPMLQSVGLGLRYYTPVGPLRLDVAFPLNRRHHLDGPFQIYFSIGQSF